MEPEPAFIIGMMAGALLLWFVQSLVRARRAKRLQAAELAATAAADSPARLREIEELHARLAVLERIATDPAARTAAEIETLR